jgi:hypothetical protein
MGAGATIGRVPHITDFDAKTSVDTLESRKGRAPGGGEEGARGNPGARVQHTHLRSGRVTQCRNELQCLDFKRFSPSPDVCHYALFDYRN